MTVKEAEKYAETMSFRDAIFNLLQARCIPYRKATFIKIHELLKIVEIYAEQYDELLKEMKTVSVALSHITIHEGSSYGYDEACNIADRYTAEVERL